MNAITDIENFADQFRLMIRRDECNDQIIPGKRGQSQLYFEDGKLCLMVLDGASICSFTWKALGGNLWIGDKSTDLTRNSKRRSTVQDVKIIDIPVGSWPAAIRLCKCPKRPRLSEDRRKELSDQAKRLLVGLSASVL